MILCRPTVPAGFPVPAIRNACRVPSAYRVTVVRRLRDMSRVGRKLDAWRIFPELGLVRLEASRGLNGDFKSSSHPPAALNPAETGSSSSLSAICCFARSRARMARTVPGRWRLWGSSRLASPERKWSATDIATILRGRAPKLLADAPDR
jgi:hypothetical protein